MKPDLTDTITMKPRRIFKCVSENRVMARKDVWKDAFGKYHCTSCGGEVEDVTDTDTGRDMMEIFCI